MIPGSKIQKLGDAPISSGGFDVWPGVYEDEKQIAIKVIRYEELDNVQKIKTVRRLGLFPIIIKTDCLKVKDFCREVVTWKRLSHPNILELYGVTMNDNEYAMVSPWMDNGTIVNHVREDLEANPLKLVCDVSRSRNSLSNPVAARRRCAGSPVSSQCRARPRRHKRSTVPKSLSDDDTQFRAGKYPSL